VTPRAARNARSRAPKGVIPASLSTDQYSTGASRASTAPELRAAMA
jgi:hypothetical protein